MLTSLNHLCPGAVPGGFLGVDIFFVLSGFLITALLLGTSSRYGRIDLKAFYLRRARRLLPAVMLLITVFTLVVLLSSPSRRELLVTSVVDAAVLTYTFNWVSVFGHHPPWQVDHLWSLSVEEQFYLVWPILLVVLLKVASRRTIMIVTALGAVGSAVAQGLVYSSTHSIAWGFLSSPLHAHGILLGCLLGQLYVWRRVDGALDRLAQSRLAAGVALVVIAVLAGVLDMDETITYTGGMALGVLAAGVLVASMVARDSFGRVGGVLSRLFRSAPMVAIGRRSYSIYLWQNFIAWTLSSSLGGTGWWIPANVALTLACAELSYRFVERRFLRPSPRGADRYAPAPNAVDAVVSPSPDLSPDRADRLR